LCPEIFYVKIFASWDGDYAVENFCPLLMDLRGRGCLVVGGGRVALRKVRILLAAGARVLVVSPSLRLELKALAARGMIACRQEPYRTAYLRRIFLAVGCSDVAETNRTLAADCRARGVLVNIADNPELCDFFFPSLLSRGPLSIAISTEGKSPALARRLRMELAQSVPHSYGDFLHFLGALRPRIIAEVHDARQRKALLRKLAGEEFFEQFTVLSPAERAAKAQGLIDLYRQS